MSPKATIIKAELQVTDLDRHYYASHNLVLAQHPSETPERLMVRLLAFALFADERLEFGRGLSDEDEPALWRRDYTGRIEQWIEVGQPDETRLRKAAGRADEVILLNYGGRVGDVWWAKVGEGLARLKNLTVIDLPQEALDRVVAQFGRAMRLTAMIQDREFQLMSADDETVAFRPTIRKWSETLEPAM
jgi:uncharacterized protein YaeQ